MPELLLAIDAGTTTARAAVFGPEGALLSIARAPLMTRSPAPGVMEQDASKVWRTVRRVMGEALAGAGRSPADIAAIGLASQRASAVLWERRGGRPLSPLVLWSDLRGAARAAELRADGFFVVPQHAAAKLEAIVGAVPQGRARAAKGEIAFGAVDSFLIWKLTGGGAHVTDASQAWPTGYLDPGAWSWNGALIERQGLEPRMFPTIVDTFGEVAPTSPSSFGAEALICADIADQQSALVAHGGAAKLTCGTCATLDVPTGGDFVFKSAAATPFVVSRVGDEASFCVEAMVISAGAAFDWLRRAARLGRHDRFEALAASVPTALGVVFLPALSGLGAPSPDPARTGLIGGLTTAAGPAHIARAGFEGVAHRVREAFEALFAGAGLAPPQTLGIDGGLASSDLFLQILADLLGLPVRRHSMREATVLGAAICAGRGAGLLAESDAAALVRHDRAFEPTIGAEEAAARHHAWRTAVHGPAAA